ncbi:MAG: NAD-binding protein, partial [Candidatus Marinimicrobia bacterium]|nr:NAD-binding protein [Candidatus Neomarinimicrobiota bacterium]
MRSLETGAITEGETPFWWAIVTMTTVGYGDYAPSTSEGRIFAVLVMFAGISLTAMFTAVISSIFVAKRIREDKGLEKVNVKNHIILCGWNRNADKIIDSIQYLSEGRRKDLVLINDLDEETIARLKTRYRDIHLHFVAGDYTSEQILQRASLEDADTIIIIPSDVDASIQNPDEKTILATLTIKGLEPNKRLIAYLYSRDNLTHIKRANADEVVISDDFGAYMLASHVVDPGIPQILNRLLDNVSENRFKRV